MITLSILVCVFTFLHTPVLATPVLKPKPVDLVYSCLKVVSKSGKSDNIPLVLLHGLSVTKEMWHGVKEVLALQTGKRVCVVDLRNHGESPWSDEMDISAMTEDIKHFLEKIEAPKAILLGASMGGKIAVHLALNYPTMVDKIIVADMRPNGFSSKSIEELQLIFKVLEGIDKVMPQGMDEKEAKEFLLKILNEEIAKLNSSLSLDDPEFIPIKCLKRKCTWRTNPKLISLAANNVMDMWTESYGRFDGLALFAYGTESSANVGEDESNIKRLFPNANIIGVKGASHLVHPFPQFMNEVIKLIKHK